MGPLRTFLRDRRRIAALLIAAALILKALVPAGYMVAAPGHVFTVEVCADASGTKLTRQMTIPSRGGPVAPDGDHGKAAGDCPYAGLAMAALTGANPLLLALALAFILALGFVPPPPRRLAPPRQLRPPLRGPPAFA